MSRTPKPLGSHVLVQRSSPAEKSAGGIIIPEKGKEKPKEGKIIAIGNGKILEDGKRQTLQVKPGDRVLFSSYAGTEIKVDGQEFLVMEETDIFAIIEA